ncbi:hypothetical protein KIL84_022885 [Mauremys mutica]|uniref:Uncharacterized protein n=1 Tax=Mauremys mutica TaxID=74926 RepID=A0A9D3WQY3_9SAUR|nr:hypothetical protein KIL84_022885 [Mauremys mutica]
MMWLSKYFGQRQKQKKWLLFFERLQPRVSGGFHLDPAFGRGDRPLLDSACCKRAHAFGQDFHRAQCQPKAARDSVKLPLTSLSPSEKPIFSVQLQRALGQNGGYLPSKE